MKFTPQIAAAILAFCSTAQATCDGAACVPSSGVGSLHQLGSVKNFTSLSAIVADMLDNARKNSDMMASIASEAAKHGATTTTSSATATSTSTSTSTSEKDFPLPTFMMAPGPVMPTPTAKASLASFNSTIVTKTRSVDPTTLSTRHRSKTLQKATPTRVPINIKGAKAKGLQITRLIKKDFNRIYANLNSSQRRRIDRAMDKVWLFGRATNSLNTNNIETFTKSAGNLAVLLQGDLAILPHVEDIKTMGAEMMAMLEHGVEPTVSTHFT